MIVYILVGLGIFFLITLFVDGHNEFKRQKRIDRMIKVMKIKNIRISQFQHGLTDDLLNKANMIPIIIKKV